MVLQEPSASKPSLYSKRASVVLSLVYFCYIGYSIFHVVLTVQLQVLFFGWVFFPPTCLVLSITQMGAKKPKTNPKHLTRTNVRTSFKDAKNIYSHLNSLLINCSPLRGNLLKVILQADCN